MHLMPEMMAP